MDFWQDRRVLITGANGFVGSWLSETLLNRGASIYGLVRRKSVRNFANIEPFIGHPQFRLVKGDLLDMYSLVRALREGEVEIVFHLAAQAFIPESFANPIDTYATNILGTVNLLETLRMVDDDLRLHFAGSSEEYGIVRPEETPVKETNPLRPQSPYAVSKVAGDYACEVHARAYGLHIVRTRAFNHEGPRRGYQYVTTEIAAQVAGVLRGKTNGVVLGNLDAQRDWMDVRDAIRGYMLAIEKGRPGEVYNLGSGKARSVRELVQMCLDMYELKDISIESDPARYRPLEANLLECDFSRAREKLGWEPKIPLQTTMRDMIEYALSSYGI
ncbi:MAG: GDP-mannose 4,6-dehydratase [Candidatus Bathyarchaeia archaeon]